MAGADTTSILASAVMYLLLKNPSSLSKLREEVDDAAAEGRISKYVTWRESQTLPYLEACVNEATRLHPPFALPFERVVPANGLEVDGYFIPPGTKVGMVKKPSISTCSPFHFFIWIIGARVLLMVDSMF